ncbi:MAG: PQQ-binding-like beta-propeller repeat protein [Parachlamydiales bacterium]
MFGADLKHSCVYDCTPLLHQPTLKWQKGLDSYLERPPVVCGDRVICCTTAGSLYVLDGATGAVEWQVRVKGQFATAPAVATEAGILVAGSTAGLVYAYDCKSGEMAWLERFGTMTSSPAVSEGILYLGTQEGYVVAADVETGDGKWTTPIGGVVDGAIAIDVDTETLYASAGGTLYALDTESGGVKWSKRLGKMCGCCPVLNGGLVYIANEQNELCALQGSDGSLVWKVKGVTGFATPAIAGGLLFWPTAAGLYSAIDLASGKIRWSFKANGLICREVAIAGNALYLLTQKGMVYALNTDTGKELWHYAFKGSGQAGPTLSSSTLFFSDGKGTLYALY